MSVEKGIGYRRKIKTAAELREIIGARPRKQSVIMCHGTFDLVHPGHIRHLLYAQSKADILITSLTCDAHVSKADYRPFVPEELRAMNLAALEVVDYVVIDENPTPIENIKLLQPDYFAKGYEYGNGGIHPRTRDEIEALDDYGGELILTPGDIVYSSSAIIEASPPDISTEKLVTLMESEGVTFEDLKSALNSFSDAKVHVIGDTIVDTYNYCTLIGSGTSKTPTLSVSQERQVDFIGGAAVVAKHLRAAGASVEFTTVLGNDPLKDFVLGAMDQDDIDCRASIDATRVTNRKGVFIANDYRLLKVDQVDNRPISDRTLDQFCESLSGCQADAIVFSDFRHGIFNRITTQNLIDSIPSGALRVGDSQVASRWGNILDFQNFDLITPNEREARFALADQDSGVRPLSLELYKQTKCKTLILKLGERGIMTYRSAVRGDLRAFFTIDSFADKVLDPVGAGDALLAYATLALVTSKSEFIGSMLGAMAAAVACEREGNIPVSTEEVLQKLNSVEKRACLI